MKIAMKVALTVLAATWGMACAPVAPNCACAKDPDHPGCKKTEAPEPAKINYVLAEARFDAAMGKPREVEISPTPTYEKAREGLKSAAVRPPDNCLTQTASQVMGETAAGSVSLASTKCGVWLSEIEKGLVMSGFRVVSWDALRTIEVNEKVPPYKAAKKLGADVLFLFNSLEVARISAGGESAYRIEYATSNAKGHKGPPFPMTEAERGQLRTAAIQRSTLNTPDGTTLMLAAILDATAILTDNGESIWFYRNTENKTLAETSGTAYLFARVEGEQMWYLAEREMPNAAPVGGVVAPVEQKSAVDTGGQNISATQDKDQAEIQELMRAVTADFVESFRTGKGGKNG